MKNYILTEYERGLIKEYLETGAKHPQLRNIKSRAIENHQQLMEDLRLILKYLMTQGVFASEEYTPLEILEEARRDQEAQEK